MPAHRKVKIISRPKTLNSYYDTRMEDILPNSRKRKMSDDMSYNDDNPMFDGVAKKVNDDMISDTYVNPDSGMMSVEAEIGDGQSRPAL